MPKNTLIVHPFALCEKNPFHLTAAPHFFIHNKMKGLSR